MKIPTKDYKDYKVGDLIIFREGKHNSDVGYIERAEFLKGYILKMRWFKDQSSLTTDETIETLQAYDDSYVFPVLKE